MDESPTTRPVVGRSPAGAIRHLPSSLGSGPAEERLHVWLIEPYLTGSHRSWAEGLASASGHCIDVVGLRGRFWKWRMHGSAVTLARRLMSRPAPDVVLATDMLDLATWRALMGGRLAGVPVALYLHENQAAYPSLPLDPGWSESRRRRAARRDMHYAWVNLTACLAADAVLWNSAYNRDSFLAAVRRLLQAMPDHREVSALDQVAAASRILPIGLDLAVFDGVASQSRSGVGRILWNHRWEHDKDPEAFGEALDGLAARGVAFEVVILGEAFGRVSDAMQRLIARHRDRVAHVGYVADRPDYVAWLKSADVVVSTARQEFFGAAIWEAVYAGCLPVAPRGLAYPELVPQADHDAVLYDTREGLVDLLAAHLTQPDESLRARLIRTAAALDWGRMAPVYDSLLGSLAATKSAPWRVRAAGRPA